MKNFICKETTKVKIDAFEMDAYRIIMEPFDLGYLYQYILKTKLMVSVNFVFCTDHLFVNAEVIDEFKEMVKDLGILLYTEEQFAKIMKTKVQQR